MEYIMRDNSTVITQLDDRARSRRSLLRGEARFRGPAFSAVPLLFEVPPPSRRRRRRADRRSDLRRFRADRLQPARAVRHARDRARRRARGGFLRARASKEPAAARGGGGGRVLFRRRGPPRGEVQGHGRVRGDDRATRGEGFSPSAVQPRRRRRRRRRRGTSRDPLVRERLLRGLSLSDVPSQAHVDEIDEPFVRASEDPREIFAPGDSALPSGDLHLARAPVRVEEDRLPRRGF
eukprot:31303-Pelagococcus_subviridis.AAC.8